MTRKIRATATATATAFVLTFAFGCGSGSDDTTDTLGDRDLRQACDDAIDLAAAVDAGDGARATEVLDDLDEQQLDLVQIDVDDLRDTLDDGDLTAADVRDEFVDAAGCAADDFEVLPTIDLPPIETSTPRTSTPRTSTPATTATTTPPATTAPGPTVAPTTVPAPSVPVTSAPPSTGGTGVAVDLGNGPLDPAITALAVSTTHLSSADPAVLYREFGLDATMPYIANSAVLSFSTSIEVPLAGDPGEVSEIADVGMATTAVADPTAALQAIVAAIAPADTWQVDQGTRTGDTGVMTYFATATPIDYTSPVVRYDVQLATLEGSTLVFIEREMRRPGTIDLPAPIATDAAWATTATATTGATLFRWSGTFGYSTFALTSGVEFADYTLKVDGPAASATDWLTWAEQFCAAAALPITGEASDNLRCDDGVNAAQVFAPFSAGKAATATLDGSLDD